MEMNVRALRARLAEVLRRAEGGERIIVTVAGRPAAQLGPVDPVEGATLAALTARGLLVPARRGDRPAPEAVLHLRAGARLDRLVAEVRGS